MESFTEISDIDAIIEQADEPELDLDDDIPLAPPTSRINLSVSLSKQQSYTLHLSFVPLCE